MQRDFCEQQQRDSDCLVNITRQLLPIGGAVCNISSFFPPSLNLCTLNDLLKRHVNTSK